jgi:histone demethylase JARID1
MLNPLNILSALSLTDVFTGTRANLNYLDQLAKFHKQRNGTNLNRFPSVDKRPLDLYKLKKFVGEKGGFDSVCRQKRWAEIGRDLGYSGKIMSSLSTSLKNSYQKWLQPYEDWLRYNKPNVLQQQEFENGGPYTPSPAPTPIKSQQHTPSIGASSPAVRASSALNAALLNESNTALPSVEASAPPPRYQMSSGFTPVNAGGFTAVNAPSQTPVPPPQAQSQTPIPSSFSAINAQNGIYHSDTGRSTPQRSEASPMSSANTPDMRPFAPTGLAVPPPLNGQGLVPLKRGLSSDEPDSVASGDGDAAGRRSKRRKQGEFLTASCMHSSLEMSHVQGYPGTPRV